MKRLFFIALVSLCLNFTNSINAEIRNAYEQQITEVGKCIENIHKLLSGDLNEKQKERLDNMLQQAKEKQLHVITMYKKTETMIRLLEKIDPALYQKVNSIKNKIGEVTHVYVELLPYLGERVYGLTNLDQDPNNPDRYISEFGTNTVHVQIAEMYTLKEMNTFVHELGHVIYQVPNLAKYVEYYDDRYDPDTYAGKRLGHEYSDPSHRMVLDILSAFKKIWKNSDWKITLKEIEESTDNFMASL